MRRAPCPPAETCPPALPPPKSGPSPHTYLPARSKRKSARAAPPRTPEPVDGRRHIDIQTDAYLEELADTVPEVDTTTQTDAFLDRPPTPLFVPQKTGLDATTQIENGGWDVEGGWAAAAAVGHRSFVGTVAGTCTCTAALPPQCCRSTSPPEAVGHKTRGQAPLLSVHPAATSTLCFPVPSFQPTDQFRFRFRPVPIVPRLHARRRPVRLRL